MYDGDDDTGHGADNGDNYYDDGDTDEDDDTGDDEGGMHNGGGGAAGGGDAESMMMWCVMRVLFAVPLVLRHDRDGDVLCCRCCC